MKNILTALFIAVSLPAYAEEPRIPAIEQTIQSQIDAFLADDFGKAFTYASPNIQRLFRDSSNFGAMVKRGYPMVHRPSEVEFLELRRQGPLLFQKVMMRDANGIPHFMEYNMIETESGWQIDGVQLLRAPAIGA